MQLTCRLTSIVKTLSCSFACKISRQLSVYRLIRLKLSATVYHKGHSMAIKITLMQSKKTAGALSRSYNRLHTAQSFFGWLVSFTVKGCQIRGESCSFSNTQRCCGAREAHRRTLNATPCQEGDGACKTKRGN